MRIRRRVIISGYQNSRITKPNLFFVADRMGLSGWIMNLDPQKIGVELQGDERLLNLYLEKIIRLFGISAEQVESVRMNVDQEDDGSVKIG